MMPVEVLLQVIWTKMFGTIAEKEGQTKSPTLKNDAPVSKTAQTMWKWCGAKNAVSAIILAVQRNMLADIRFILGEISTGQNISVPTEKGERENEKMADK